MWWERAYRHPGEPLRARQFEEEVRASLPVDRESPAPDPGFGLAEATMPNPLLTGAPCLLDTSAILDALRYQRLRLLQDQQLPEWGGLRR